jgi:ADP-ribose pyrophosphatase YjhB (NUDIX family)
VNREYPERPLAGVGAVVVHADGCVLLIRRGQPPRAGEWSLPGGLVKLGEPLGDAVRREVREECSVDVRVGPLAGVFQAIERDAAGQVRFHYIVLDYLAYHVDGVLRPSSDAADAAWVEPEQLAAYCLRPETIEMIERALALRSDKTLDNEHPLC